MFRTAVDGDDLRAAASERPRGPARARFTASKATIAATAVLGGLALAAVPAQAQGSGQAATPQPPPAPAQPERTYNLSRAEQAALRPLLVAVNASDWPAAQAALPAAAAAAGGADARYVIGQIRLRIGIGTSDRQLQAQGVDDMIASGGALPREMRALYENQLGFATQAGDTAKAQRAMAQLDLLNPNDPARLVRLAQVSANANDAAGAIAHYQQAMQLQQAAGQAIPIEWRQQIAGLAYRAHMPQTVGYMREWLIAAPTSELWHNALAILAELGRFDSAAKLDVYRLMRAAGAMNSERDYVELAEAANDVRTFGEIKAVLEEGLHRNLLAANAAYARGRIAVADQRIATDRPSLAGERTAALAGGDGAAALRLGDAYYGYGQYGPAAELYRAALQKGGVDANLANVRLGAALALAGQRAPAEAAFRAVTGPRAELALFWLLWLSTRG